MPRTKQTILKSPIKRNRKKKDIFLEGITVKNIYSNMEYLVVSETDTSVFVKDSIGGTLEIAKADLVKI